MEKSKICKECKVKVPSNVEVHNHYKPNLKSKGRALSKMSK